MTRRRGFPRRSCSSASGTGVAAGLLGVGGGILIVPFLTLALGLSQHAAEATSLVVVLPTAVVASLELRRRGVGDLGVALRFGTSARSRRRAARCSRCCCPPRRCGSCSRAPRARRPPARARRGSRTGMTQTTARHSSTSWRRRSSRACSAVRSRPARGCARSRSRPSSASAGRRCGRRCASSRPTGSSRCSRVAGRSCAGRAPATCARRTRSAPSSRASPRRSPRRCIRDDELRRLRTRRRTSAVRSRRCSRGAAAAPTSRSGRGGGARGVDRRQRARSTGDPGGAGNRRLQRDHGPPPPELPARPDLDRARRERAAARGRTSPSTRRSSRRSSATIRRTRGGG